MGLRFHKSLKLAPGLRLNFSRGGIGLSAGRKGATISLGPKGTRATVGLPGSGLSWSESSRQRGRTGWLFFALIAAIVVVWLYGGFTG